MRKLFSSLLLSGVIASFNFTSIARPRVVASFGGECNGAKLTFSTDPQRLITRLGERNNFVAKLPFGHESFAYDLNGDGRSEYFVRLGCGGTGNCSWGVFADRPARLLGTFTAWFFYVHRRTGSWNTLSTYTREGGDQGAIATLAYRRKRYVQTSWRTEQGYPGNWQPFLKRMGVPKCRPPVTAAANKSLDARLDSLLLNSLC